MNRSKQPYAWTDVVPEDDPEFQGLLEDKEAIFPDINAEFSEVELEEDKDTSVVVTDEPEPDFETLAAAALTNADIVLTDRLQAARASQVDHKATASMAWAPRMVEAKDDKIVYEITMDLPDAGLLPGLIPALPNEVGTPEPKAPMAVTAPSTVGSHCLTRLRRSALNNQPYNKTHQECSYSWGKYEYTARRLRPQRT